MENNKNIYSVSRLNTEVRQVLEGSFPLLWVEGELSNLSRPASGHIYFTLKDPAEWTVIGTPRDRLDTPEKITGRATFGMDVQFDGLLTAVAFGALAGETAARQALPSR